jgi:hypothetical protein
MQAFIIFVHVLIRTLMIRLLHLIFLFLVLTKLNGQPPEFSIIGPGGAISEVSIIAGTSLLLSTNYDEIRGANVLFPDNHRTSSDRSSIRYRF